MQQVDYNFTEELVILHNSSMHKGTIVSRVHYTHTAIAISPTHHYLKELMISPFTKQGL